MECVNSGQVVAKQFDVHCEVRRSKWSRKAVGRIKERAAKNCSEKGEEKECLLARGHSLMSQKETAREKPQ